MNSTTLKAVKILSIWDYHQMSADAIERGLELNGVKLRSVVRCLIVDSQNLKSNLTFMSSRQITETESYNYFSILLRAYSQLKFRLFVSREIRREKPDLLLCHFGQTGARFIRLAKRKKLPIVIGFYGHDISAALKSKRWARKYKRFTKYPCTLVVMCKEAKGRLLNIGCLTENIHIWNIPIDLNLFYPSARSWNGDIIKAVTCARFMEKKGYPRIFNALQQVRDMGIPIKLDVFGYGGNYDQTLSEAQDWGVEELITWHRNLTGTDFDLKYSKVLRESDIFLFAAEAASNGDDEGGSPLSVIMAQASGIPVISSYFSGFETTLVDEQTGFLCTNPIEDSIVAKILDFRKNSRKYFNVGIEGSKKANEEFDFKVQSQKLVSLLDLAIGKNNGEIYTSDFNSSNP